MMARSRRWRWLNFWPSNDETLNQFAAALQRQGIETTVREKRGLDIDGACGQLRRRQGES